MLAAAIEHPRAKESEAWRKPRRKGVVKWAEESIFLSERFTNWPGLLNIRDRTPYLMDLCDAFENKRVRKITWCAGAQVAKTTFQFVTIGYAIDQTPGPALLVLGNADQCKKLSEERLHPIINESRVLSRHKPANPKKFRFQRMYMDRMSLSLEGSNSPTNLASRPIRFLYLDEVDKYPQATKREGGAVDLAIKRVRTYPNHKIIMTSTPTLTTGEIWTSFLLGDQRKLYLPCPQCGEKQTLDFERIKFAHCRDGVGGWDETKLLRETYYECVACQNKIENWQKPDLLTKGEWRVHHEMAIDPSWHTPAYYSPWLSFGELALEWIKKHKHVGGLKDVLNNTFGEPWEERGEVADEQTVLNHRGDYDEGTCPEQPLSIIITADVQKVECYYTIRAWCEGEKSYLLRYGVVQDLEALQQITYQQWQTKAGPMAITYKLVDAADGNRMDEVIQFGLKYGWTPIRGRGANQQAAPVKWSTTTVGGAAVQTLNVQADFFKDTLQVKLKMQRDDPGGWQVHRQTRMDFAEHLTAEARVEEPDKWGRPKVIWKRLRRDNHWLDCEMMQLAWANVCGYRYEELVKPKAPEVVPFVRRDGRGWHER